MIQKEAINFTKEDIETIVEAFNDPLKIQLLFKILKKPDISSKELKNELMMNGTKIYYYLTQLSKENKENHSIIIAMEHKDETREHLIMKTYRISPWMEECIKSEKIFKIYDNESKNKKWHYLAIQRIALALMGLQLHEFEMKDEETIEEEIKNLPVYNFALITQKTADHITPSFKKVFDELCSLEDQQKPLFTRLIASDYTIILNSTKIV